MTESLCTCGKRPKHKCCEESEHKSGKMCLSVFVDKQRLLKDSDYRNSWVKDEVRKSGEYFLEQIYGEPKPNNLSVEDTFDIMFGRYQHALKELSEK